MLRKIIFVLTACFILLSAGCAKDNNISVTKTPIHATLGTEANATPTPTPSPTPSPTEKPVYPTVEPGTGKYHGGIKSDAPYKYEAFDVTTHDSEAIQIFEGDSVALQFFATTTFNEVAFICPNMGDAIGNLTLRLYAWAGTYDATVAQAPLHEDTFVDYIDNSWLVLKFSPLPDGEYLLVAEDPVQNVGVWKTNPGWDAVRTWVNGEPIDGVIKNYIQYTNTPNNLFYKISE